MAKISLTNGQDVTILDYMGDSYVHNTGGTVGATFSIHGNPIVPIVDECESDGAQSVNIDASTYITDSLGNNYMYIVGGRPRTRKRS